MQQLCGEGLLRRDLGWVLASLTAINATIGAGIFRVPGTVARSAGSLGATILLWVAGGLVALCGALSLAELGAAMPRAGGMYEYLRRAYGPWVGFLLGWTKLLILVPSVAGTFAAVGAESMTAALELPSSPARDRALAALIVAISILVNLGRVRASVRQQGVLTFAKVMGLAIVACAGWWIGGAEISTNATAVTTVRSSGDLGGLLAAAVFVMWAFDGWSDVTAMAGEIRNPGRTIPLALGLCVASVTLLYTGMNLGLANSLGFAGLAETTSGSSLAVTVLATNAFGAVGGRILSVLLFVSCLSGCMGALLTGSRLFVPLSTDGLFPRWLGHVSQTGVPRVGVIATGTLGVLYASQWGFEELTEASMIGYFPFYALVVASVFVLRRKEPSLPRPFRTPLYPLMPAIFIVAAVGITMGAVLQSGWHGLWAVLIALAGLLVRWVAVRLGKASIAA